MSSGKQIGFPQPGLGIVGRREFYAAFNSGNEYQLVTGARSLGTLPYPVPLAAGTTMLFSGRNWSVLAIDAETREVEVEPADSGKRPGSAGGSAAVAEGGSAGLFSAAGWRLQKGHASYGGKHTRSPKWASSTTPCSL